MNVSTSSISGKVGDSVSILGSGFGVEIGSVTFGKVNATVNSWSDTSISVVVPAITASVKVNVTNKQGNVCAVDFSLTANTAIPVDYVTKGIQLAENLQEQYRQLKLDSNVQRADATLVEAYTVAHKAVIDFLNKYFSKNPKP